PSPHEEVIEVICPTSVHSWLMTRSQGLLHGYSSRQGRASGMTEMAQAIVTVFLRQTATWSYHGATVAALH
ncbi:MAG: hypothetical protein OSB41_09560, partial [Kiritimatiellae bacterium]|nr:hypothetical protein [Kiritimatiellia bacterium]